MVAAAVAGWLSLAAGAAPPEPAPSAEWLRYLAEFEDVEGNPVDPLPIPGPEDSTAAAARERAPGSPEEEKADAPPDH
jgi:hypothetical protein